MFHILHFSTRGAVPKPDMYFKPDTSKLQHKCDVIVFDDTAGLLPYAAREGQVISTKFNDVIYS